MLKFICLYLFSISLFAKVIVISDIDDTIRKTNVNDFWNMVWRHFRGPKSFDHMKELYYEIDEHFSDQGHEVKFYYVSTSINLTYSAKGWLNKFDYPEGKAYQRSFRRLKLPSTKKFKTKTIESILKEEASGLDTVFFFGDNANHDPEIYKNVWAPDGVKKKIFIRDIIVESTYLDPNLPLVKEDGIHYFLTEKELVEYEVFNFTSDTLRQNIEDSIKEGDILPKYVLNEHPKRLVRYYCSNVELKCKDEMKDLAEKQWNDYFSTDFDDFLTWQ